MEIKSIGYPFYNTYSGMFNPTTSIYQNAKSKLLNLLCTSKGQRVISNNCQFGIDIQKYIFQNINDKNTISKQIQKQIKKWILQIKQVNTQIKKQNNIYRININYKVNQKWDTLFLELNINE